MTTYKTPGVYVKEVSLFPPSVAEVATAVPAFIGYTKYAKDDAAKPDTDNSLNLIPTKIKSLLEYETYFGGAYTPDKYSVFAITSPSPAVDSVAPDARFYLYDSLRLYFDNGGGDCYIVSVGLYKDPVTSTVNPINKGLLIKGIEALTKYDEPTLIIFPDAVGITGVDKFADLGDLQQQSLAQCAKLQDRFTVMDIMDGFLSSSPSFDPFENFRQNVGMNNLGYGAVYYPWIKANFLPDISWSQLKFCKNDKADPPTTIDMDVVFSSDTVYQGYKKKKDNLKKISDTIDVLENAKSDISSNLSSIAKDIDDATTDAKRKGFLTDYLKVLSDIATFFPAIEAEAGEDLKKVLQVLKNDPGLQAIIINLIKTEKNDAVIALNKKKDVAAVESVYAPSFTGSGSEWIAKTKVADIGADSSYVPAGQAVVVADLIVAKIPEKLIAVLLKIQIEAESLQSQAERSLLENHPFFKTAIDKLKDHLRLLPPSGAMAGIYAKVDRTRGVWKAPANVSVNSVIGPAVKIDSKDQENLNVHTTGKSINAIRAFTGKGTLVWGARTLAGNDNEWRYVPVRRFFNMVEESVKKATEPFTFEPNDKNTWVKVKAMIENYLTLQWRAGALQGAKPEDAYFVNVGLGETMTGQDILEGRMIVEIGMAVVRPAEFIILRFSHKMNEK